MHRKSVSTGMLVALSVVTACSCEAFAQGGTMLPESVLAPTAVPMSRTTPKMIDRTDSKAAAAADKFVPLPANGPFAATGRIMHVQNMAEQASRKNIFDTLRVDPKKLHLEQTTFYHRPQSAAPMAESFNMGVYNSSRASARMEQIVSH